MPATAKTGEFLTCFLFRQLTRTRPEAAISYTLDGERFERDWIAESSRIAGPTRLARALLADLRRNLPGQQIYLLRWTLPVDLRQQSGRYIILCGEIAKGLRLDSGDLRWQVRGLPIRMRDDPRAGLAETNQICRFA